MKREERDPDEEDLHEDAMDDEETAIDVAIYIENDPTEYFFNIATSTEHF